MREFKKLKKLAVVDIETGAKTPDAHIYSIGCCIVDVERLVVEDQFYTRVSNDQKGRVIESSTLNWWLRQANESPEAFAEIFQNQKPAPSLRSALVNFVDWLLKHYDTNDQIQMVGNGPEFDNSIILHAFEQLGMPEPWPYWNNQSLRTFKLLNRISGNNPVENMPFEGVKHHAGDDAHYESLQLIEFLKASKNSDPDFCLDSLKSRAAAWDRVVSTLNELSPYWLMGPGNGIERAELTIRKLAASENYDRYSYIKEALTVFNHTWPTEPVSGWRLGWHGFSDGKTPHYIMDIDDKVTIYRGEFEAAANAAKEKQAVTE